MLEAAWAKHIGAWETLAAMAVDEKPAKYAIYASRTLAVRHPEVYLRGDRWFYEGASRLKGFAECYEDPTALGSCHMDYGRPFFEGSPGYEGIPDGSPLDFRAIDLGSYRPASPKRVTVGPYDDPLDHRFGPLAVALKAEGRVVTPLELAEIAYFAATARGRDPRELFLALAVDGGAYLLDGEHLLSMETLAAVARPAAAVTLVFNEDAVWYPLMERNDWDPTLQRAIARLECASPSRGTPSPELIRRLREGTALASDGQMSLAALAAVRAVGWRCHPYYDAWRQFVPEDDFDITISRRLCVIREFDRLANSVSPAAAHLFEVFSHDGTQMEAMRRLSREYLVRTGVVREAGARGWKPEWRLESWGHVWPCGLMEHTIDDAFRSRTGHCVSQCHMMGSVLSMTGTPHVVVNFDRGGVNENVSHHFVLSQDGTFLVDDGLVNFRGVDANTEDYGPLLSFAVEGEWARTVASGIYGNVSPARLMELLRVVERALGDRFPLQFYLDRATREPCTMDELAAAASERGVEGVTLP